MGAAIHRLCKKIVENVGIKVFEKMVQKRRDDDEHNKKEDF